MKKEQEGKILVGKILLEIAGLVNGLGGDSPVREKWSLNRTGPDHDTTYAIPILVSVPPIVTKCPLRRR